MKWRVWAKKFRQDWRTWVPEAVCALGLFGLLLTVFGRRIDPDFGWHLQAGRYLWAHGVPAHDVFSYTAPNFPWVDHEWLSDVMTAGLYALGRLAAVAAIFAAVWTAALVMAVRVVVRRPGWRVWPVYAVGFAAVAADAVARPNAWTALGLAVVLWASRADSRWVRDRRRWWLVAVFGLWANLHGGFVIGLVALGVAAVRERRWRPVVAWSVVATFANPYGAGVYVEIWRTMSDTQLHSLIGEWEPLRIGVVNGFYLVLWLFVVITQFVLMTPRWRYEFGLPAALLAASLSSQRQFPLFVVATLGQLAEGHERLVRLLHLERGWRAWALPGLMTVLGVGLAVKIAAHPGNDWPVRGLAALQKRPCAGRLLADYNFGGLVIWQVPGTKVYIDGRMPSWRGDDGHGHEVSYLANYARVVNEAEFARAEIDRYGVKCVLWDKQRGRLIKQLVAEGWRVDVKDERAVLLRRD
jgi:hypothetical protein